MPCISQKDSRAAVQKPGCVGCTAYQVLCFEGTVFLCSLNRERLSTFLCPLESSLTLQLFAKLEFLGDYKVFADLWPYSLDMPFE